MTSPKDTQYLFIDMNAFFASCEQEMHPELRHKPVAVTPVNVSSSCIISPSYEAKAYGVKTGILVGDARLLCPLITIKESDVKLYLKFHNKLAKILTDISPFTAIKSVDEAVIKLSPSEQNTNTAWKIACNIKKKIREEIGQYLRSSIGIGPNVWLAKMAAESKKPDGLVEVKLKNLRQFYQSLKLIDLKGINFRMAKRLNTSGIYKPVDLYSANAQTLREKLGIIGDYWYLRLHGYDIDMLERELPKSIGHSHILEPMLRSWPKAWAVCQKLVERAGRRLREEKMVASGVHLWLRYLGKEHWHKGIKSSLFSDSQTFLKIVAKLWQEAPKESRPLGIGVKAFNLSRPLGVQQNIFPHEQKLVKLYQAIDKINDHYGAFTIKPANILQVESSAPNRIAFGKPIYE